MEKIQSFFLLFLISIFPLIIRLTIQPFCSPYLNDDLISTGYMADSYNYYKWLVLMGITIVFLAMLLYRIYIVKIPLKKTWFAVPLFFLSSWLVLSLFASAHRGIALKGFYDRYEGVLTYLCFFAIAYCIVNIQYPLEKIFRCIAICFSIPLLVNIIFNLSYLWNYNLGQLGFMKSLLIPAGVEAKLTLNTIFFNQNYSSGLSCAACYFYFSLAIASNHKKEKIFALGMSCVTFASLLASLSTGGFLTFTLLFPVFFLACLIKFPRKQIMAWFTLCIFLFVIIGFVLHLTEKNKRAGPVQVYTEMGSGVYKESIGGIIDLVKSLFSAKANTKTKSPELSIPKENDLEEFSFPPKKFSVGTGRLYLWKITLDFILQKPLFGYGMDTYAYYCPHYRKDKINNLMATDDILITKPHNFYLAIAFGAGIPALLAMIALFIIHFARSFSVYKQCSQNQESLGPYFAVNFFLAAFCIQWLFNDSVLYTSIFFWCFLALGERINSSLKQEKHQP